MLKIFNIDTIDLDAEIDSDIEMVLTTKAVGVCGVSSSVTEAYLRAIKEDSLAWVSVRRVTDEIV